FIGKEPLFKIIGLKNLLHGLGNLPLNKHANKSALETIIQAIKQVKGGMPMGVFPEAKRTYSDNLIEFKPGAFKLVQKAKADISPVCLYNMHALSNKVRILPTKVYLTVLPVIKYEDYKDLDSIALSKKVFKVINDQMEIFKKEKE
ncbi:MAG: 1-acyl-sn-glycerol-3-phosphate acyltransferase, partial [Tenericutes bacterium]|nr:1-acyl-sn-glycerol-3-phosphate acyltransferase [Mycoplasmatota bacterium]